jgi:ATP-dependent DNA helicase RecQ
VSPLISLMKDQVDALNACGIRAAFLNSSLSAAAQQDILKDIRNGDLKILYLAPERLLTDRTFQLLAGTKLSLFAIDEAHCVSEWGHDFRPEYRGLSVIKKQFPGVAVHAYTATATPTVRDDIIKQLGLKNAQTLIGSMDRPNLNYQLRRREPGMGQILEVLEKHKNESGIIYCISRKKVENTAAALAGLGYTALPYHAGMTPGERKENQEAFLKEEIDIIVATVAFGMGIDKSNVRFVIHHSMPKSLEAYQQETGRAGRDGLDADCWMFHSPGDIVSWQRLTEQSMTGTGLQAATLAIKKMGDYCNGFDCRHVGLAGHFGEKLEVADCEACDVCLNEIELVDDPLILGQKIVSGVYRVNQKFGGEYVALVLTGSQDKRILENGHDQVSTYGLLSSENKKSVRAWIDQLIGQDFLAKSGEYNVLTITDKGHQLLRGELTPRLAKPLKTSGSRTSSSSTASWEGVDEPLFEKLRAMRASEAQARAVPAYVIFSDASLRDMARRRPSTLDGFHLVNGVGKQKLEDYGKGFLAGIIEHCTAHHLSLDVTPPPPQPVSLKAEVAGPSASAVAAFPFFDQDLPVEDIAKKIGRAKSTTEGYLQEYLNHHQVTDASRWVDAETIQKITGAASKVGTGALKPIYVELGEKVSYHEIRIVVECLRNRERSR